MKQLINNNWYFTTSFNEDLLTKSLDELVLEKVRIPHTVKELTFNYCNELDYQMVSGYVYEFEAPVSWKDKSVCVTFLAAGHEAEVYLNGEVLGKHSSGYTAFSFDLGKSLRYGEVNRLVVKLDSRENLNIPPFGHVIDYMTYGGIYRDVYFDIREKSHLSDVYIVASMNKKMTLEISGVDCDECELEVVVCDSEKNIVASLSSPFTKCLELEVVDAKLWGIDSPNLYAVNVKLIKNNQVIDEVVERTGFRDVEFKEDGFYLNKKKVKIRGLNRHQSYPYVGYAMPKRAQILDADILKYELGCNAVRTSHYPQSHDFIGRCDEIGLLVFTEIPGWQHIGDEEWKQQAIKNTEEMVLQYRNHPSIFIWGVRINESLDDDALYQKTNELAHSLDKTRPTGGVRYIKKSHLLEDVYTYNDFFHNGPNAGCEPKKNITPDMSKGYLVTENNGHMFPTKVYDWEKKRLEHALRHARVMNDVHSYEDIAGHFNWCMFDYNTHRDFGSGDRICYHGVLDMFRNPKLAASVFAAEGCETPVLEVSSSMDIGEHPAGYRGEVYAFTNADFIELYKNDEYVGSFKPSSDFNSMKHGPICVDDTVGCLLEKYEGYDAKTAKDVKDVLYSIARNGQAAMPLKTILTAAKLVLFKHFTIELGTILYGKYIGNWGDKATEWKFVGKKDGKEVISVTKGTVDSIHLEAKVDTQELVEGDTWDVASIRIRMVDNFGNLVPYVNRVVSIETEGPIELIGPKNVALQGGYSGCYVRTTGELGEAKVILHADNLQSVVIVLQVREGK